nr:MAG TPA: hypothetical protein [Bacteriophage sp.]
MKPISYCRLLSLPYSLAHSLSKPSLMFPS